MRRWADTSPRWARWVVPVILFLITWKMTYGVFRTFDVGFDDETVYLDAAHFAGKRYLPLADSSPLYPLWYRLLSVFQPDLLKLYFLNWLLLTASLPILLYALARRSGASMLTAGIVAVLWAMSGSVMTWPFVSKFATIILALGALSATYIRDRRLAAAVTVASMALASYARAELALPSLAFGGLVTLWSLVSVVRSFRTPKSPSRSRLWLRGIAALVLAAALPLALRRLFGDPHQGGRAFFAFAQHYALNVVEDRHLFVDVWTTWHFYTREAFPKSSTIPEAFRENPAAFLWHLRRNLLNHPHMVDLLLEPMKFIPASIAMVVRAAGALVGAAATVGVLVLRRAPYDKRLIAWLPLYIAIAITTFPSTLLVYPREHYLVPLTWLTLAVVASLASRWSLPQWLRPRWFAWVAAHLPARAARRFAVAPLVLGALLVLVPSRRAIFPSLLPSAEPPPSTVQEGCRTIEELRKLHLRGKIVTLESDHARGVYANWDFVRIAQWDKNEDFWPFIDRHQIELVVLNDRLREDVRFKSDPAFAKFVDGTGDRRDFVFFPVEGTRAVIAVRERLLKQ